MKTQGEGGCLQAKKRPQEKPNLLTPDLRLLASRTVRQHSADVEAAQSVHPDGTGEKLWGQGACLWRRG